MWFNTRCVSGHVLTTRWALAIWFKAWLSKPYAHQERARQQSNPWNAMKNTSQKQPLLRYPSFVFSGNSHIMRRICTKIWILFHCCTIRFLLLCWFDSLMQWRWLSKHLSIVRHIHERSALCGMGSEYKSTKPPERWRGEINQQCFTLGLRHKSDFHRLRKT